MPILTASELFRRAQSLPRLQPLLESLGGASAPAVYLVGGAVRDLLSGQRPADLDLAVEGELEEVTARLGGALESHDRFTTATLALDGSRYDLARTRAESYAHPGALPDVRPAGIDEDLSRRDFTVNAIALGLSGPRAGELVAAPGALADLEARTLAVLHERSFEDDPTRLLRLARYRGRLGFAVAPRTLDLAAAAIALGALNTVSGARVGNELRLLAGEPDPVRAFEAVQELNLGWTIDAALARRALSLLPDDGRPDLLVLALALGSEVPDSYEFPATDRDLIIEAAGVAPQLAMRIAGAQTGSEVAHAVGAAGVETVALASALGQPERLRWWLDDLRKRTLQITGTDLIERGIPEGPEIGRRLGAARDAMWDGSAPDRQSQLEVALA